MRGGAPEIEKGEGLGTEYTRIQYPEEHSLFPGCCFYTNLPIWGVSSERKVDILCKFQELEE